MKRPQRQVPSKAKSRTIIVYFPLRIISMLNAAAIATEKDRNEFICLAVREKMRKGARNPSTIVVAPISGAARRKQGSSSRPR